MIKITRKFKYTYPIDKNLGNDAWDCRILLIRGISTVTSYGMHPILAGWYRLQLIGGRILVDITLTSIVDQTTGEELLLVLTKPEYREIYSALVELCRDFQRQRLLGKIKQV